jgi:hypothetical protein
MTAAAKQRASLERPRGMSSLLEAVSGRPIDWPTAVIMVSGLLLIAAYRIARLVYRLRAERARSQTIVEILRAAPSGTEITQGAGPGGPALQVRVGARNETADQADPGGPTVVAVRRQPGGRGDDDVRSAHPSRASRRVG